MDGENTKLDVIALILEAVAAAAVVEEEAAQKPPPPPTSKRMRMRRPSLLGGSNGNAKSTSRSDHSQSADDDDGENGILPKTDSKKRTHNGRGPRALLKGATSLCALSPVNAEAEVEPPPQSLVRSRVQIVVGAHGLRVLWALRGPVNHISPCQSRAAAHCCSPCATFGGSTQTTLLYSTGCIWPLAAYLALVGLRSGTGD